MTDQGKIKKLAEFAGFRVFDSVLVSGDGPERLTTKALYPDNTTRRLPDFLKSETDCFKWLVPNFPDGIRIRMLGQLRNNKGWFCSIGGKLPHHYSEAETPAEALCEAILQLIEKEE